MAHELHSPSPASAGNLQGLVQIEHLQLGNMPARSWAGISYMESTIYGRTSMRAGSFIQAAGFSHYGILNSACGIAGLGWGVVETV
jgi:hypothetical protein